MHLSTLVMQMVVAMAHRVALLLVPMLSTPSHFLLAHTLFALPALPLELSVLHLASIPLGLSLILLLLAQLTISPVRLLATVAIYLALGCLSVGRRLDAIEPYGLIIIFALLALGVLNSVLGPLFSVVQGFVLLLAGVKGG